MCDSRLQRGNSVLLPEISLNREGSCSSKLMQRSIGDDKRMCCIKTAEKSCCLYRSVHFSLSVMGLGGAFTSSLGMGIFILAAL